MPMRNTGPRTFKEVMAAQDLTEMARLERGDRILDPSVSMPFMEVSLNENRSGSLIRLGYDGQD
jgi:hypothetical protein